MRKGKTYILVAVLLIAVIALAGIVAACGSSSSSTSSSASASAAAATPMDIATKILGHAPTGLAATIVNRGSVIVANDANYPPQSSVDQATGKLVGFDVDVANKMGRAPRPHSRLQEPRVGDHPGRPAAGQVRRLHRLDDHHA